jgi:glyoxylase-like metal-dependent hydrolase (beta-lactamase superfamily II)
MCHEVLRRSIEVEHVVDMVRLVFADRVQFHDGSAAIAPGIEVCHIGGHTPGIQAVSVRTRRGWVVLASDASHFRAHMEQGRAFPVVSDVSAMLEGHHRLRALAPSPAHVIPGHDPLAMSRYPAAPDALTDGVARLDADPRAGTA